MPEFDVQLLAWTDGEIRKVNVPQNDVDNAPDDLAILERIFYYGQNDFQPQQLPSVSVGDVATVNNKNYLCRPLGWREIPDDELAKYKELPRRDRNFYGYDEN